MSVGQRRRHPTMSILVLASACGWAAPAFGHSTGITTNFFANPGAGCNTCHFGGQTPTVTLTGPTSVVPGTTNIYTLTINNPASQQNGGLNVSAPSGTFSTGGADSANTKTLLNPSTGRLELTHSGPKAAVSGVTTFSLQWTAPSSFTSVTLTGWGNAVDGSGTSLGDAAAMSALAISAASPPHDAVVLLVKPVKIVVPVGKPVTRKLHVKVRNADPAGVPPTSIQAVVSSDCPAGVSIGQPDFVASTVAVDDTVTLAAGHTASAVVPVTIHPLDFSNQNHKAPSRCTLTFSAAAQVPGNTDPTPPNNTETVELSVVDKNAPEQATNDESLVDSLGPLTVRMNKNVASVLKKVRPKLTNADIIPAPEAVADAIQVSVDLSDCAGISLTALDVDPFTSGAQNTVMLKGGKSAVGMAQLSFDAGSITTRSNLSPTRCTAVISTAIAGNSEPDGSNNTTRLMIDVIDANDF